MMMITMESQIKLKLRLQWLQMDPKYEALPSFSQSSTQSKKKFQLTSKLSSLTLSKHLMEFQN